MAVHRGMENTSSYFKRALNTICTLLCNKLTNVVSFHFSVLVSASSVGVKVLSVFKADGAVSPTGVIF